MVDDLTHTSTLLQIYYEPTKHWLPQRRFKDSVEREAISAAEALVAGSAQPAGRRDGFVHAVPFVAVPRDLDLGSLVTKWITES